MDTRRFLSTIAIAVVIYILVSPIISKWNGGGAAAPGVAPVPAFSYVPATLPAATNPQLPAPQIVLGDASKASTDKLAITIDTLTAGIDKVQLNINNFAETVKKEQPYTFIEAVKNAPKPFATLAAHIITADGKRHDSDLYASQQVWEVVSKSPTEVVLRTVLNGEDGKPLVNLTKVFTIDPASYDVSIRHGVANVSDQPLSVSVDQLASTDLPRDNLQGDDRGYDNVGLDTTKKTVNAVTSYYHTKLPTFTSLASGINWTQDIGSFSGPSPLLWTSDSNRFFAAITRPGPTIFYPPGAPSPAPPTFTLFDSRTIPLTDHVASANIDAVLLDPADPTSKDPSKFLAVTRLTGAPVKLLADETATLPLDVFFGPKQRDLLNGKYVAPGAGTPDPHELFKYGSVIHFSQGSYCGFCTFEPVANVILRLLDFLHATIAFHNYGVAIILLVLVVRAILHPLTRASQINMAQMGKNMKKIQPLLEANKKKYAKDSKKQQEEQLRIYRENNVNPAGPLLGCLPMLLQTPIWIALYAGLRVDIDLRHASFIPGWINDLSNPDTILPNPVPPIGHPLFTIPILHYDIYGLNLLPILLVFVYYFNMKVSTASQPAPADDQQAQMQKISKYMIFLFPIFLYNAPSGLNLYIFASTVGGLIDTWFIRKTLKKRGILPQSAPDTATPNPLV